MKLINVILRLYPQRWRERYADEMVALLEEHPPTWRDLGDMAMHALDARLNPALLFVGVPAHERRTVLMRTLRSREMTIFAAFITLLVAYFQFSAMFDEGPYSIPGIFAQDWSNPLSLVNNLSISGVHVAVGAVLIGGAPLVRGIWRQSPHLRGLLIIPIYAFFAALVPPLIIRSVAGPRVNVYLSFVNPVTFAYTIWFVVAALISTIAVTRAVVRSDLSDRLSRFTLIPCMVIIGAMLMIYAVTLAWGPIAYQLAPRVFTATDWDTGFPTWVVDVGVMTIAVVVALVAAMQGIALIRKPLPDVEPVL
jgi:hypothetical protein